MVCPSSSVTIAFLTSLCVATMPQGFLLAFADKRVDGFHLDAEQLLDRRLDVRLRRRASDIEDHLIDFGRERRLLGDDRRADHVICLDGFVHLNRASSASTAALVRTSFLRRRMS